MFEDINLWSDELSWFDANCQPHLTHVLLQLDALLSRTTFQTPSATPELSETQRQPSGFDGIERTGSLSRLLPTEWGFLKYQKQEFYRRLLMAESLYYKQAYAKQQLPHLSYILLDRGPDQYGAPFIIQLCFLLILIQHNKAAAQPLKVGFLQDPGQWLTVTPNTLPPNTLPPNTLQNYIHSYMSHARLLPAMLTAWRMHLSANGISTGSVWLVTSTRETVEHNDFTRSLLIAANPYSVQNAIVIDVSTPTQQAQIQLPYENMSLRLLRNPFDSELFPAETDSVTELSKSNVFEGDRTLQFQFHPLARVGFFYNGQSLYMIKIPNRVVAKIDRLKCKEKQISRQLLGIWKTKEEIATVEADQTTLYCINFFQQHPIAIPIKQINQQLQKPLVLLQPKDQNVQPLALAYATSVETKATIIFKDRAGQTIVLFFRSPSAESAYSFEKAIALGTIKDEQYFQHVFYYLDSKDTRRQITIAYEALKDISIVDVSQFSWAKGMFGDRQYINKKHKHLTTVLAHKEIVGYSPRYVIARRGDNEIYVYTTRAEKMLGDNPLQLSVKEDNPIEQVSYLMVHDWVIYRSAAHVKVHSLELNAEIVSLEVGHDAL